LQVAAYALSCLCIPVSNAVVEWVCSHVSSVFKMWKSFDFECVLGQVSMLCHFCLFYIVFNSDGFVWYIRFEVQSNGQLPFRE